VRLGRRALTSGSTLDLPLDVAMCRSLTADVGFVTASLLVIVVMVGLRVVTHDPFNFVTLLHFFTELALWGGGRKCCETPADLEQKNERRESVRWKSIGEPLLGLDCDFAA
jgi:hypothetical protein